jgi:hypothetical protein
LSQANAPGFGGEALDSLAAEVDIPDRYDGPPPFADSDELGRAFRVMSAPDSIEAGRVFD